MATAMAVANSKRCRALWLAKELRKAPWEFPDARRAIKPSSTESAPSLAETSPNKKPAPKGRKTGNNLVLCPRNFPGPKGAQDRK